jgi:hypothetical protein
VSDLESEKFVEWPERGLTMFEGLGNIDAEEARRDFWIINTA